VKRPLGPRTSGTCLRSIAAAYTGTRKLTRRCSVVTQTCDECSGTVRDVLNTLLEFILPTTCAACGVPGRDLCDQCDRDVIRPSPTCCARCGHPWNVAVPTCPECPRQLDRVRHGVTFAGPIRPLIHAFKDGRRRRIALTLAELIAASVEPPQGVLVPVPSTAERMRRRGFNPAEVIAHHLGRLWNVTVLDTMARPGEHIEQRGASPSARTLQVRGAFTVSARDAWPPVTLVDDVLTTGATLSACARTVRRCGARSVAAVVAARVDVYSDFSVHQLPKEALPSEYEKPPATGEPDGSSHQGEEPSGHRRTA
jgi:ComF family protein